jgi:hypothetical protein
MVFRCTAWCDFRKQTPIVVAPGHVLEGWRFVVFTPKAGVVV